jgi:hypothetical protein
MNKGIQKLKQRFEEDPITVIVVASLAATAAAKVLDTMSSIRSRNAYANQINNRVR